MPQLRVRRLTAPAGQEARAPKGGRSARLLPREGAVRPLETLPQGRTLREDKPRRLRAGRPALHLAAVPFSAEGVTLQVALANSFTSTG